MTIENQNASNPRLRDTPLAESGTHVSFATSFEVPARILMCVLFLVSGFGKLAAVGMTESYMKAYGIPTFLVWPAAALEIVGGICILIGLLTRPVAAILAVWCLVTAAIFHIAFADQNQLINFLKNLAMAGGFIILAQNGGRVLAVDAILTSRARVSP